MRLVKGSYQHDLYEAALTIQRKPVYAGTGNRLGYTETWGVSGFLQADDQSALTTAILDLERAYARDGDDIRLQTVGGSDSAHILRASDCRYIRCSPISYPVGTGAQYSTYRTFEATIEAFIASDDTGQRPAPGSIGDLESYTESIEYSGTGGPVKVFVPVVLGDWPEQQINSKSPIVIRQSGSAVGATGKPNIPPPLFPDRIQNPMSDYKVGVEWPKTLKPVRGQYPVSWSYTFTFMGQAPSVFPGGPI